MQALPPPSALTSHLLVLEMSTLTRAVAALGWNNLLSLEQKIAVPHLPEPKSGLFEDISFLITLIEPVLLCVLKYSLLSV